MAWWIFQHVVTTAALAALVALLCRVTRIGPVTRHALWVLVLIKFVTPPLVAWPWTMPDPLGLSAAAADVPEPRVPESGAVPTTHDMAEPIGTTSSTPAEMIASSGSITSGRSTWEWIAGVWLSGSLLLAAVEGVRLFRLARRTRTATPASPGLSARVTHHASRMGLPPVPVVLVDSARAPSVWGLFRPRILWPVTLDAHVPEAGTDGLIVHELAHVKRRDHLVGWVELAGGILWWWNPLFWSVRSALREQAELACDAWVISALPDGRRAYAESLLALSGPVPPSSSSMAVIGISASTRRALERRLVMIMKGRTSLRLSSAAVCSLALVAVATLPTWAASPQVAQPPVVVPTPVPAAPTEATPAQRPSRAVVSPQSRPATAPPRLQTATSRLTVAQRPAAAPPRAVPVQTPGGRGRATLTPGLPDAARDLAEAFSKDQQAYLTEAMQKISVRREVFHAEMQRLQDEYTKAGKLDDAVAVRDYLRQGTPGSALRPMTGRGGRGSVAAPVAAPGRRGGGGGR